MITLIEVVSTIYPNIKCVSSNPNVYSAFDWLDTPINEIPTEQNLLDHQLSLHKEEKIATLSNSCRLSIVSGFVSDALGSDHIYDSEEVDQINIVGAFLATMPTTLEPNGTSILYACRNVSTQIKTYVSHSHEQIKTVLNVGAQVKLAKLYQFNVLRDDVNQCTTIAEVDVIEWTEP